MARENDPLVPRPSSLASLRLLWVRYRWIFFVFAAGFIVSMGRWIGRDAVAARAPAPLVDIEVNKLDFGVAWEDPEFLWILPLTNSSRKPIRIDRFETSCGCTSIRPASLTIPVNETREVEVKLDLVAGSEMHDLGDTRDFHVEITPAIAGASSPSWKLQGVVRRAIDFNERELRIAEPFISGATHSSVSLHARRLAPAVNLGVAIVGEDSIASAVATACDPASGEFTVAFTPAVGAPEGHHRVKLRFSATDAAGKVAWSTDRFVSFAISNDVHAIPDRVLFGRLPIGESRRETVTLATRSGRPLAIESVAVAPDNGLSAVVDSSSGNLSTLSVLQECVKVGNSDNEVQLYVRDAEGKLHDVRLHVQHEGIEGDASPNLNDAPT